ncbi:hypothetical protein H5410_062454 [Solanum commersonii]|uniref:Uncharacterized protein n=1 Tax=Solanum commersonii TaxID=4109 RepID=A0A9J5WCC7_SOLCO|nr:hypothetical protein H5410_062454 [Solanum commersonii]
MRVSMVSRCLNAPALQKRQENHSIHFNCAWLSLANSSQRSYQPVALSVGTQSRDFSFHVRQIFSPKRYLEVQPRLSRACQDHPGLQITCLHEHETVEKDCPRKQTFAEQQIIASE